MCPRNIKYTMAPLRLYVRMYIILFFKLDYFFILGNSKFDQLLHNILYVMNSLL